MSWVVYSETVRRHVTSVAYCTVLALLAMIAGGTARFDNPAAAWPSLIAMLAVVLGCAPIGPEFSSGTLQLILVKPVNRAAYLLSRVAGVVTVVWIAALVTVAAEAVGRAMTVEKMRRDVLAIALLNNGIAVILIVALLVLFGTFTRAYFNVALYVLLQMGLGVTMVFAAMGKRFPRVVRVIEQVMNNLFPDAPLATDLRWTLLVLSNAAVALLLACLIFRRREVPYGGD